MPKVWKLVLSIIVCEFAGIIGSIFTISAIPSWYQTLNKPSFAPPNFIFAPVWTALYALMGISLYLLFSNFKRNKNLIYLFFAQLFFNAIWTPVFFGLNNLSLALIIIIILWSLILICILEFYKINNLASILLIPYLLWVSFATALNYQFLVLNK